MTSFTPWLKPTLLGPLMSLWSLATVGTVLVGMATLSGGRFDSWLIGMLWASFFGCALGVLLIGTDVLLLRLKWRRLPTGTRAWISSTLAPLAVFFLWTLPFWPPPESALSAVFLLTVPMALGSFLVRMAFGQRP